jgi:hypothetical protein
MGGAYNRHGRDGNIKMYLKETGCENLNSLHLDHERDQWRGLVNTVIVLELHKRKN